MAILAGAFAGVGLVWLAEYLDDRLRDAPGVLKSLQLPTLARIPQAPTGLSVSGPLDAGVAAGISELRSNLLSALRTEPQDHDTPVVALASAHEGDGKSAVAANLAVALARTGRRVTLVDADLARPAQAAEFKVKTGVGLAEVLSGQVEQAADCLVPTAVDNLQLLPAGTLSSKTGDSPALLLSKRLPAVLEELQRGCDVLIVDTPGVTDRSEGAWLSARADAVVLVVDAQHARKRTIDPVLAALREAGATVVGVVLNHVPSRTAPLTSVIPAPAAPDAGPTGGQAAQGTAQGAARRREVGRQRGIVGPATDR